MLLNHIDCFETKEYEAPKMQLVVLLSDMKKKIVELVSNCLISQKKKKNEGNKTKNGRVVATLKHTRTENGRT